MAKTKAQLVSEAEAMDLELTGEETNRELEATIATASEAKEESGKNSDEDQDESLEPSDEAPSEEDQEEAPDEPEEDSRTFEETESDTADLVNAQPKVQVFVPLEDGEAKGTFYPVAINGHRWNVPKGVSVEVPQEVANIISQSLNIYVENSASKMRADRDSETETALA